MTKKTKILSLLLAVLMLAASLPLAGLTAFAETSGDYEYTILDDSTAEITKYNGSAEELTIPSELDGYTVTSLGNKSFEENFTLLNVVIPDTVTRIGNGAFYSCMLVTNVTIPDSVTSIGYSAFDMCSSLKEITIPGGATMGDDAFGRCFELTKGKVIICEGVTDIPTSAFVWSLIEEITIPKSVKSIGKGAFCNGSVADVYFTGTEEEWNEIAIDEDNDDLINANIHFNAVIEEAPMEEDKEEPATDANAPTIDPIIIIVIAVAVIGVAVAAIVIVRKKKTK